MRIPRAPRTRALGLLATAILAFGGAWQAARAAECIYCGCETGLGFYASASECTNSCFGGLGCFEICVPVEIPGDMPSEAQAIDQAESFPALGCYGVTASEDDDYNCIAASAGVTDRWVWSEVDWLYGDADGVVEVEDFDGFYARGGYVVSPNCTQEVGLEKVALYACMHPDGTIEPTHAARQRDVPGVEGEWWESKEGREKQILHQLDDLTGEYTDQTEPAGCWGYGEVYQCYERPN
ncbi:hypothetical protein ACNOYE_22510 [Nannocystaceae bacterium ST9]